MSSAATAVYPVWLPMTDMAEFDASGLVIRSAQGVWLEDTLGRRLFAGSAGLWNVGLGFGHPKLIEAITQQLRELSYGSLFRYSHVAAERLAVRLLDLCPPQMARVLFTTSGSGAVDAAVMGARRFQALRGAQERDLVVSLAGSYHGTTGVAMAVTGENLEQSRHGVNQTAYRKASIGAERAPVDGAAGDAFDGAGALRDLFAAEGERVGAVIVEPVLGSSCTVLPAPVVAEIARQREIHGFTLVVDEVATGFGRTGPMFACDWLGITPDILVLSKQINSGYLPLAATVFSREIVDAFDDGRVAILRGETQGGNPAACAAAIATLEVYEDDDLLNRVGALGPQLAAGLDTMATASPHVVGHRGMGLMRAIDLVAGDPRPTIAQLLDAGVMVHPSTHGICLMPPLVTTPDEMDWALDRIASVLVP